jgi:hypothetical protein
MANLPLNLPFTIVSLLILLLYPPCLIWWIFLKFYVEKIPMYYWHAYLSHSKEIDQNSTLKVGKDVSMAMLKIVNQLSTYLKWDPWALMCHPSKEQNLPSFLLWKIKVSLVLTDITRPALRNSGQGSTLLRIRHKEVQRMPPSVLTRLPPQDMALARCSNFWYQYSHLM